MCDAFVTSAQPSDVRAARISGTVVENLNSTPKPGLRDEGCALTSAQNAAADVYDGPYSRAGPTLMAGTVHASGSPSRDWGPGGLLLVVLNDG
jgi:hypothetical protein